MGRWKINLYAIWSSRIISQLSLSFGIPFLLFYIQKHGVVDPDKIKLYTGIPGMTPSLTSAVMAPLWGIITIFLATAKDSSDKNGQREESRLGRANIST
ncbi:MAG TPA: multidrug efflux MFS transporter [Clostridiaceae bacterium]|nr:multidrug efflux MFS transporter [Clostridiaceae bacterium]